MCQCLPRWTSRVTIDMTGENEEEKRTMWRTKAKGWAAVNHLFHSCKSLRFFSFRLLCRNRLQIFNCWVRCYMQLCCIKLFNGTLQYDELSNLVLLVKRPACENKKRFCVVLADVLGPFALIAAYSLYYCNVTITHPNMLGSQHTVSETLAIQPELNAFHVVTGWHSQPIIALAVCLTTHSTAC